MLKRQSCCKAAGVSLQRCSNIMGCPCFRGSETSRAILWPAERGKVQGAMALFSRIYGPELVPSKRKRREREEEGKKKITDYSLGIGNSIILRSAHIQREVKTLRPLSSLTGGAPPTNLDRKHLFWGRKPCGSGRNQLDS